MTTYKKEKDIENIKQTDKSQRIKIITNLYLNVTKKPGPMVKKWYLRMRNKGEYVYECLGEFAPSKKNQGGHVSFSKARELLGEKLYTKKKVKQVKRELGNPLFSEMCEKWLALYKEHKRETTYINAKKIIKKYVEPSSFYNKKIKDILKLEISDVAYACPAVSAKKLLGYVRGILEYANETGYFIPEGHVSPTDVVPTIKGLQHIYKEKHFNAIVSPAEFGKLIRKVRSCLDENFITSRAILFLAYNFCRSKEMLSMQWKDVEIDFDGRYQINLPACKTKENKDFIIPYSTQTRDLLLEIRDYRMKNEEELPNWPDAYVFHTPGNPFKPMTSGALEYFMHKLGYYKDTQTPHSFRGSASTMLREKLQERSEVIETQLGHSIGNKVQQAYDKAEYLDERRSMLQRYADYIDSFSTLDNKSIAGRFTIKVGKTHPEMVEITIPETGEVRVIDRTKVNITDAVAEMLHRK